MAAENDPSDGDYSTYSSRYRWNRSLGGRRGWRESGGSSRLTKDSRTQWRMRTDSAMIYLERAAKAARTLQRLEREARQLGLEPTFEPGELKLIAADMDSKYRQLGAMRNRKT